MAKAPDTSAAAGAVKFPPNWSKMTHAEKRAWQKQNRPGYKEPAAPAKPPTEPAMGLAPEGDQEHGKEGAAADYNRGQQMRRSPSGAPTEGETTIEDMELAAADLDAHAVIAKILRTIADAFQAASETPLDAEEPTV